MTRKMEFFHFVNWGVGKGVHIYMDKPFIHLLRTSQHRYLYDVNQAQIIEISGDLFKHIRECEDDISQFDTRELEELYHRGFLKSNRVEMTKHCETEYLPYYLKNKMNTIILQVTRTCNLRCEYCIYSGTYVNRSHENKFMTWELAKKGIDYLAEHSRDSKIVSISFYGGEPLMAFELIKKCVKYANERFAGKKIVFSLTTNATLLRGEILEFFVEHEFDIMISLDGPKEYHDKYRRYANSNKGSFDTLMKNIRNIKEIYPQYYDKYISYNTVLDPARGYKKIDDFFRKEKIFSESSFSYSVVNDHYTEKEIDYSDEFIREMGYATFLLYLYELKLVKKQYISNLMFNKIGAMVKFAEEMAKHACLPRECHHGGPCIPGVFHTFLNLEGDFYPCERVSELSEVCCIGDIESGINPEKAKKLLNIGRITEASCRECWAYEYCQVCCMHGDDLKKLSGKKIVNECQYVKARAEGMLLDICVLKELGFDFEAYYRKGNN